MVRWSVIIMGLNQNIDHWVKCDCRQWSVVWTWRRHRRICRLHRRNRSNRRQNQLQHPSRRARRDIRKGRGTYARPNNVLRFPNFDFVFPDTIHRWACWRKSSSICYTVRLTVASILIWPPPRWTYKSVASTTLPTYWKGLGFWRRNRRITSSGRADIRWSA